MRVVANTAFAWAARCRVLHAPSAKDFNIARVTPDGYRNF
jgi:hypothetical protein